MMYLFPTNLYKCMFPISYCHKIMLLFSKQLDILRIFCLVRMTIYAQRSNSIESASVQVHIFTTAIAL